MCITSFEMFVAHSLVGSGALFVDFRLYNVLLTFETLPSYRAGKSIFTLHTQMCTLCIPAHQDLGFVSIFIWCVTLDLSEAVMFVCVHVIMCQHYYTICIYGRGFIKMRLRLLVATMNKQI